jgi:hypothetical protein
MGRAISEYQIRAFRDDGELSLVMLTPALSDDDAREQASALITGQVPTVEIWHGASLVDTLHIRASLIISSIVGTSRVLRP